MGMRPAYETRPHAETGRDTPRGIGEHPTYETIRPTMKDPYSRQRTGLCTGGIGAYKATSNWKTPTM